MSTKRRVTSGTGPVRAGTCAQSPAIAPTGAPRLAPRKPGDRTWTHPGAQRWSDPGRDPIDPPVREGPDADPLCGARPVDGLDQRLDRGVGLRVDVHPDVGPGPEQVLEHRYLASAVDTRPPDLVPGEVADRSRAIRDPIEPGIVEGDQHTVCGDVHVGLEVAIAEPHRCVERGHRVLGCVEGAATVRERDRAGMVEECWPHPIDRTRPGAWARRSAASPPIPTTLLQAMDPTTTFLEIVQSPDRSADLAIGALALAAHDHEVDVDAELRVLDNLAESCSEPTIVGLRRLLFDDIGFSGRPDDYYAPANSFLDRVLESRQGIPISLSVVTIEVARRLDIELVGVGMPAHFLVRSIGEPDRYLDPFHGGAELDAAGCAALFRRLAGDKAPFRSDYLRPVPTAAVLSRMAANLVNSYRRRDDRAGMRWSARAAGTVPRRRPRRAHRAVPSRSPGAVRSTRRRHSSTAPCRRWPVTTSIDGPAKRRACAPSSIECIAGPGHLTTHDGLPVVRDAIAWLVCAVEERIERYDHDLFLARVTGAVPGRLKHAPLLYSSRLGWRVAGGAARESGESVRDRLLARLADAERRDAEQRDAAHGPTSDTGG